MKLLPLLLLDSVKEIEEEIYAMIEVTEQQSTKKHNKSKDKKLIEMLVILLSMVLSGNFENHMGHVEYLQEVARKLAKSKQLE